MKIEIGKTEGVRRTITLTADASEVAAIRKSAIDEVRKYVKVPGFRPGKAPDVLVLQRQKDTVNRELRSKLRDQALRHVNLFHGSGDILTVVSVEIPEAIGDGELVIPVELDMRPEFELPDYCHVPLPALPEPEVSEAEIDEQLRHAMEDGAKLERVRDDRPLAEDDVAEFAIAYLFPDGTNIFPDGKPVNEVTLCPRRAESFVIPEVARGTVGMTCYSTRKIPFVFPESFGVPELTGTRAIAHYTLTENFIRKICPVEEFAQKRGFGDVQRLREHLRREILMQKEFERRRKYQDAIISFLCGSVDFPLPLSILEKSAIDMVMECMRRTGIHFSEEEMKKALQLRLEMAKGMLKKDFILGAIAKKEAIEITSEDLGGYLYSLARAHGLSPDALVRVLKKDEDLLHKSRKECLMRKVLAMLLEWNLHGRPTADSSPAVPSPAEADPNSMLVSKKELRRADGGEGKPAAQSDMEPAVHAELSNAEPTACMGLLNAKSVADVRPIGGEAIACAGPTGGEAIACEGPMGTEPTAHVGNWGKKD